MDENRASKWNPYRGIDVTKEPVEEILRADLVDHNRENFPEDEWSPIEYEVLRRMKTKEIPHHNDDEDYWTNKYEEELQNLYRELGHVETTE